MARSVHADAALTAAATFFNLQWVIPPYPTNHTVPGSMLRFDYDSSTGDVDMSFLYTTFDTTTGTLLQGDLTLLDMGGSSMPFAQFQSLAQSQLYLPCVNLTAAHP